MITVATLSSLLDRNEGVALQMFNEQSSEYYAKLVVYDTGDLRFAGDSYSIDEMDRQSYSAAAMIYGSLISDIRSGTGPDVILGAQGSIELLDSTYLMDMTPYLQSESFDASKYYMNIIEASKIDGKAFFIPTMFSFMGIATDSSRLEDGQKGFTYEQYAAFVKEQLNGVEPVTQATSRMHFMNLCLENSYTDWFKNDKVDFDCDEFREMAVFFKDNVPEGVTEGLGARVAEFSFPLFITDKNSGPKRVGDSLRTFDDGGPDEIYGSQTPATYAVFFENFSDLQSFAYMNYFGDNMKVVGLPSDTGTGPSATICGSFSITAGTPVEDGAYAFLEILLSEEVLTGINYSIPINRAAALQKVEKEKKDCLEAYRMYKNIPKSYLENSLQETCRMAGGFFPDSKTPDIFLETIENIETVSMCDSSVMMIVTEEIPPYFVGQKDIDSVISIINSRTQIVFDER